MKSERKLLLDAIALEQRCRFINPETAYLELAMHNGLPVKALDKAILQAADDFRIALEEMSHSLNLPSRFVF